MLSGSILHERSEVNYTVKRKQNKINSFIFYFSHLVLSLQSE